MPEASPSRQQLRYPWRLFLRVVSMQGLCLLIILGLSGLGAHRFFRTRYLAQVSEQLRDTLEALSQDVIVNLLGEVDGHWCENHAQHTNLRLVLLSHEGKSLCDSGGPRKDDFSELARFRLAMSSGWATALRTISGVPTLNGTLALRRAPILLDASLPLPQLAVWSQRFDTSLFFGLAVTTLVLIAFALWSGRALVFPVGRLLLMATTRAEENQSENLDSVERVDFLSTESSGEWSELESSIHSLRRDLQKTTESLRLEREEVATLMGSISDGILAVDLKGHALFFNARFVPFLRRLHAKQSRVHLAEIFRNPQLLETFDLALKDGKTETIDAFPVELDGRNRFFSLAIAPLRRRNQEVYGAVGIFHDVTELKRAEQIRIDFVANVSHELRTPLTSIRGYVETMLQDVEEGHPIKPEFLKIIVRNTRRLGELIADLLDLSSLEGSEASLEMETVSTEELSQRAVRQMEAKLASRKQSVMVETTAPAVFGDASRIEQVLVNLLENAHKFTPDESTIRIVWDFFEKTENVLLKVIDSGPGVAPEHHSRLFERFYRVDKARSREMGGTGLGLAIVKHIMQSHGGSVRVESVAGQGATFVCLFPAKKKPLT